MAEPAPTGAAVSRHRRPPVCPVWTVILAAVLAVPLAVAIVMAIENARGRL